MLLLVREFLARYKIHTFGIALIIILGLGVGMYGKSRYAKGVLTTRIYYELEISRLNAEARGKELAMQEQMDKVREESYEQKKIADAAIADANNSINSLRTTVANQARRLATTKGSLGINKPDTACWNVLNEALGRYQEVARDADELVERLRIGQGWANSISIGNSKESD